MHQQLDDRFLGHRPDLLQCSIRGVTYLLFGIAADFRDRRGGLFGIRPDALAGELAIEPGWPADWPSASLRTPTVELSFSRDGSVDRYRVVERVGAIRRARLRLRKRSADAVVTLGNRPLPAAHTQDAMGREYLDMSWTSDRGQWLRVEWLGAALAEAPREEAVATDSPVIEGVFESTSTSSNTPNYSPVDLAPYFNDRVTQVFRPGKYVSPRSPFASLAMPSQGIGSWAGHVNASADIDDTGLRRVAAERAGIFTLPTGVEFRIPVGDDAPNVIFTSQWDNYPRSVTVPLQGRARRVVLLMAGTTNHMQSRFDNGQVEVQYTDGSRERLTLHNPTNWWPIDQDYFLDDFQFRRPGPIPMRVDLKTGMVRREEPESFKGRGRVIPGGAATVLELGLDPHKELSSLAVTSLANEVVIGLMAATLVR